MDKITRRGVITAIPVLALPLPMVAAAAGTGQSMVIAHGGVEVAPRYTVHTLLNESPYTILSFDNETGEVRSRPATEAEMKAESQRYYERHPNERLGHDVDSPDAETIG